MLRLRSAAPGTVAVGKDADLLLTANPPANIAGTRQIAAVVARGRAYPAPALAALLQSIKNK